MKRKITYFLSILIVSILLSGCGLFNGSKEDIDPPKDVSYEEDLDLDVSGSQGDIEADGESADGETATIQTELYLIDSDGFVVPRTFSLPNTESVAKQALEYLVTGGPITDQLPNEFRAVLPADTAVDLDITDGVATVNFSNEFAQYAPEDELKIVQSVTWTLTQFDSVDRVKLQMNGNDLSEMPVNGTPLNGDLTRKIGINLDTTNVVDITNTRPVTVYYLSQTDEESYYVPVTKRIQNSEDNTVAAIVEELVKGPDLSSPLFTMLMPDVELLNEPEISDGVVTLNFNENILGSYEQKLVSKQVMDSLVLSLTEQEGIKGVAIQVNGEADIVNQDGEPVTEPVTRPKNVNTGSF
ncbi:GerMN domain-containing protein [Caldibacillus lycopersici]|uniref:GerMN domain-containing protein n=1 Tax=Perspicuibacillus lycopersici TaxID=1325689 RepID=A0AAE3LTI7_9BACI|nr:GerMN domain-containing protein [Perspicuibacillus lycopersici]MCU9614053.1 GerMN domain-containing protein [Perspicuibacillus lycopersici]